MEHKIGEIFEYNGEWYQCVKSASCEECAFLNSNCINYPTLKCSVNERTDCCTVIFKKLEKVGEPYRLGEVLIQQYQGLIPVVLPEDLECESILRVLSSINVIEIIIEQNKEDMEENNNGNTPLNELTDRYVNGNINYDEFEKEVKALYSCKKEDMEEKKPMNLDKNDEFGNVYTVYKHISPNGKEYVGMTRNIQKRWEGNGCSYTKNSEFRNDIMKYGWDNFQHIIIKDGLSLRKASKLEDELIVEAMNRGVAYNIARGGIGGSHPAWNKGIPLSEEQKAKLTAANKGKKLSDETKRKIGDAGRGRVFSEETRRKIGDKNRGKKHSKEHTEKWIKSNRWRFRKIEIRRNQELIGVFDSIHGAVRQTGLTQGFIYGILKSPKGKHQGYTIIILD